MPLAAAAPPPRGALLLLLLLSCLALRVLVNGLFFSTPALFSTEAKQTDRNGAAATTPGSAAGQVHYTPQCSISTRARFSVPWVDGWHNNFFAEVQQFAVAGLQGHGLDVNTPKWPSCYALPESDPMSCLGRISVVTFFGVNQFGGTFENLRGANHSLIIFNLEVATMRLSCFSSPSLAWRWRASPVWDYSLGNQDLMVKLGLLDADRHNAAVLQLTHYPGIVFDEKPVPPPSVANATQDIPVLFMASPVAARRKAILDQLAARGVVVRVETEVWGKEKEALIRRARVVLNVHYYNERLMESVRLFHALSVGAFVLSEDSPDTAAMALWERGVTIVPYDKVADAVVYYLGNATARHEKAAAGYELVRSLMALATLNVSFTEGGC
jgi:hypothetical protein